MKVLNYLLLLCFIILSFGHHFTCCLGFGYGLGDLAFFIPIWIITLIYLIIMLRKKTIPSLLNLIFLLILLIFIFQLLFNRGIECPCGI
jgi:energy-coupling factor transporter transmembrane protein EcfT